MDKSIARFDSDRSNPEKIQKNPEKIKKTPKKIQLLKTDDSDK